METKDFFAQYTNYVNAVTADISKNDDLYKVRLAELSQKLKGNYSRLDNAINGLSSESGEVLDVWKKIKYHGLEYSDETRDMMIKELGDVCWYLFQTALALNIPMEEVINRNIEKLQKRHPNGYSSEYLNAKKGK